ncbi:MAG: penicillin-binding protein 2 [Candidatus Doudnabacteria bacterium]|nr:penicillin-binding protein 2 [Candidatus Doudnabacteria bacterium]
MRNPFTLKNTIESKNLGPAEDAESLDFEESLMDPQSQAGFERTGDRKFKTAALWFFLLLIFAGLFGRLYYLAIAKHDYYRKIAEGNRLRIEYLSAPRGAIYDSQGEVLAQNKPSFELVASPLDLPQDEAELNAEMEQVSEILGVGPEEIREKIFERSVESHESVLLKQNLNREQALIFHEQINKLPGFRVVSAPIRDYKDAAVFAHALGYVGKINAQEFELLASEGYLFNDSLGKTGVEQIYETDLRGEFGERQVEVDAKGVVKKVFGEKDPVPGSNLYLNIDAGLQKKLYEALTKRLVALTRKKAAAIAMDPRSGRILAFLSLPSFDNNLFAEGISPDAYQKLISDKNQPLFNRAISGIYPPGSTVKPMVAASALQEGTITTRTIIDDRGYIVIRNIYGGPDYYFYGYGRKALGLMDVRRAIELSSDIFFYIVGGGYDPVNIAGLGIEKLAEYYRQFKLGSRLDIDLPGEEEGLVPDPEWKRGYFAEDPLSARWYLGDTYHVSIGQGDLLVTPLQILSWTATIANGGKIYKPFLADRIQDNQGELIRKFEPEIVGEPQIEAQYLGVVREGMRQAVVSGTARSLNSLPITSAGKTGTAQFDARNPNRTHAWFTAFAPYEEPQIAIVVLIEDGGEGGVNSVPVVREVLDWWAKERYLKK